MRRMLQRKQKEQQKCRRCRWKAASDALVIPSSISASCQLSTIYTHTGYGTTHQTTLLYEHEWQDLLLPPLKDGS